MENTTDSLILSHQNCLKNIRATRCIFFFRSKVVARAARAPLSRFLYIHTSRARTAYGEVYMIVFRAQIIFPRRADARSLYFLPRARESYLLYESVLILPSLRF